jgi:hypothetical protein
VAIEDARNHPLLESLESILGTAFSKVEGQIKRLNERQRGHTKKQHAVPLGIVVRKHPSGGTLRLIDGGEIDFHVNSVAHHAFKRLALGTMVRYATTADGSRVTTVSLRDKPGVRQSDGSRPLVPEN